MSSTVAPGASFAIGSDANALWRILDETNHLALWRRSRPVGLAWLDALDWDAIDDLDFPAALDTLDADVAEGLLEAGYPRSAEGAALAEEIVSFARSFAVIMGCEIVKIRLEIVETNACRRFHADVVEARLLATLSGSGTQWISVGAPGRVDRMEPGDVAIFKGGLWAQEPAILHRSPPIAGTGDTRLLLVIDPHGPGRTVARG